MADESGTVEGVRQRNLGRILRLVHHDGPQSRAALTDATGLNRSTVADLVGLLVEADLVIERAPDPSRRVGRPSPIVAVSPVPVAIAVNPEVDALEIAAVGLDQQIVARVRHPLDDLLTPERTADLVADQLAAWRAGALAQSRIVGLGLAVPGLVRAADGVVRDAPHLQWRDAPLGEQVALTTGLPTTVGNDASLGALAEHLYGAARGIDDVVYLNGGASGIGGGLIVGGVPVGGAGGYAGEFGQNRPGIADAAARRARDGVLEDEVSRSRLLAVARLTRADDDELAAALATASPDIADEVARQRGILATALANAVNVLNPAVIVLGGFLAALATLDVPGLEDDVRAQSMPACAESVRIVPAALAGDRLLIGAAEAVFVGLLENVPVQSAAWEPSTTAGRRPRSTSKTARSRT
ncbi:MAG TPA: ROK family transcriptional regulator [Microbacterium sp.]|nr:ROK family transcriptional regulator [Microbacterium sp.]